MQNMESDRLECRGASDKRIDKTEVETWTWDANLSKTILEPRVSKQRTRTGPKRVCGWTRGEERPHSDNCE